MTVLKYFAGITALSRFRYVPNVPGNSALCIKLTSFHRRLLDFWDAIIVQWCSGGRAVIYFALLECRPESWLPINKDLGMDGNVFPSRATHPSMLCHMIQQIHFPCWFIVDSCISFVSYEAVVVCRSTQILVYEIRQLHALLPTILISRKLKGRLQRFRSDVHTRDFVCRWSPSSFTPVLTHPRGQARCRFLDECLRCRPFA